MKRHTTRLLGTAIVLSALLLAGMTAAFAANGSTSTFFGRMMSGSGSTGMMSGSNSHRMLTGTGHQSMMTGQGMGSMISASYSTGMMTGQGMRGMMSGNYSTGMMSDWALPTSHAKTISIKQAAQSVQRYIDQTGNKNLAIDEVIAFQRNFYAIVKDKSTGHGAFEVLVNQVTGAVFPEFGPAMMWNTRYGMMSGTMGSMMGYQQPNGPMTVSVEKARQIAQGWLNRHLPGARSETPDQFPGYYTIHFLRDGKIAGMLSVNGYTGQIWYHSWHGQAIRILRVSS
jgi:hypothetical protein